MSEVLVIAPHPDDETLGCGGMLLRHKARGDRVAWMLVTGISEAAGWSAQAVSRRRGEIETVQAMYGFDGCYLLNYPAARLDTVPRVDLVESMTRVIRDRRPDTVYLPNGSDVHSDHRIVFQAALSGIKSFRAPFVKRVLMYETLSETEYAPALQEAAFVPNVFADISEYLERKIEIMNSYAGEMSDPPFPRSQAVITALAAFRGSRAAVRFAEAFMLIQEVL